MEFTLADAAGSTGRNHRLHRLHGFEERKGNVKPEWTFGLLLGFHVDQRAGTLLRVHSAAGMSTRATFPVSPQIRVIREICGLTLLPIDPDACLLQDRRISAS